MNFIINIHWDALSLILSLLVKLFWLRKFHDAKRQSSGWGQETERKVGDKYQLFWCLEVENFCVDVLPTSGTLRENLLDSDFSLCFLRRGVGRRSASSENIQQIESNSLRKQLENISQINSQSFLDVLLKKNFAPAAPIRKRIFLWTFSSAPFAKRPQGFIRGKK